MRIGILSKSSKGRLGICLLAVLATMGGRIPTSLWGGAITGYRDPSGRVIFVNDPVSVSPPEPAIPSTASEPAKAPAAAQIDVRASAPKPGDISSDLPNPAGTRKQTIASTAVAGKEAPPRTAPVGSAGIEQAWNEIIEWTANRHQVDPALVRAIVRVESNFNPRAVSRRGAMGLMQLIPATARRFGVSNVFDPRANLDGGVRYLRYLMDMFGGDLKLSLAAYNAGENAVDRHNGVPPFPETQDYIRKIALLYPLSPLSAPKAGEPVIQKYVDGSGIVHFNNTDSP